MSLVDRFLNTFSRRPARQGRPLRAETLPPLARSPARGWRKRLGSWLHSGSSNDDDGSELPSWSSLPPKHGLEAAREAFCHALDDVDAQQSGTCLDQIAAARSLHELWHLRSPVYSLVSRRHAQGEANRRLAALDELFSKRARRGGAPWHKPRR